MCQMLVTQVSCCTTDRMYRKSFWKNYGFISIGSFHFLLVAFYCSLQMMDNGSALLPFLWFTVVGFAAFLDRYFAYMKKYATLINLNI